MEVIQLDVDSDDSVINAMNSIVKKNNKIDVIVDNAGYALEGALEETSMDEIRRQFETNFFGAVRIMQAAIPVEKTKKWKSSKYNINGRQSINFSVLFYHGSKFALEGVYESIQYELEPFGIK